MSSLMQLGKRKITAAIAGYSPADFRSDLVAGIVIAALSLPLSMGYAEIAGAPPVYGIWAAIIAGLVFSIITKSKHIVFGMDSATAAVTGSAIAGLGLASGSTEALSALPWISIAAAAFTLLFFALGLGRFADRIPSPVMQGFVLGITAVVITGQLPRLLGLSVASTSAPLKLAEIVSALPNVNIAALVLSVISIAALVLLARYAPKTPAAIIVLVAATATAYLLSLNGLSLPTIGEVPAGIIAPATTALSFDGFSHISDIILQSFAIALVLSIESTLCFKATNENIDPNRELAASGIANAISAVFACPPSAASLSRSAAAKTSGGKTQIASIVSVAVMLAAVMFLSPLISIVPSCALASIVVVAMAPLPDYRSISRYAQHMIPELVIVIAVAAVVFAAGAIYGVFFGIVASGVSIDARRRGLHARKAVFGMVDATGDEKQRGRYESRLTDAEVLSATTYVKMTFGRRLDFANAAEKMSRARSILENIPVETPLLLGLTKLVVVDASANDELLELIASQHALGREVYCVRKLAVANDSYTRYELRRVFEASDGTFPSRSAYEAECLRVAANMKRKGPAWTARAHLLADDEVFAVPDEQPVLTLFLVPERGEARGRLIFQSARETIRFHACLEEIGDVFRVSEIKMHRRRTEERLGHYKNGEWSKSSLTEQDLDRVFAIIEAAVTSPAFLEQFDGVVVEDAHGNSYDL